MLKLRLAERWARLGPSGAGMLVLLMLSALSLTGFWLAFEPARDPGGCVTLAARGVRAVRSCEPDDIALQILFGLAIGALFGFLVLRLLWRVGREFLRPLPDEPLHGVLQLLLKQPPSALDRSHGARIAWGGGCQRDVWAAFADRFGIEIREGYGMTETSSFSTINPGGRGAG